jgi:hypothetical protein
MPVVRRASLLLEILFLVNAKRRLELPQEVRFSIDKTTHPCMQRLQAKEEREHRQRRHRRDSVRHGCRRRTRMESSVRVENASRKAANPTPAPAPKHKAQLKREVGIGVRLRTQRLLRQPYRVFVCGKAYSASLVDGQAELRRKP